jgi:hypothetical protein
MQVQRCTPDRERVNWYVEWPGGDHDVLRLEEAGLRLDGEVRRSRVLAERGCHHTAAQWCTDEGGVAVYEPHDIIARRECVWIGSLKGKTGQLNVPVRTLESQRVPPLAPPTLCYPLPFKNYVLSSELAKVIARCQPGLSSSYDHRFNLFDVHVTIEIPTYGSRCI